LAYCAAAARADILAVFLLDLRLSRLIAQRREPLLSQMPRQGGDQPAVRPAGK
jgi:hypothetical protein